MTANNPPVRKLGEASCELGEGPHYDAASRTAWWFDILGRKLYEHPLDADSGRVHELPKLASVVAKIDAERQLLVMEDGLYQRRRTDGELTLLVSLEADNQATRSNDGRVHPSGCLWVGTMGKRAEVRAGAIYWSDGCRARRLFGDISIPNSICFSADGAQGFFADSALNRIWRVALNPATGLPLAEPEVFLDGKVLPNGGVFDGSVIDADGILWNAAFGGGSVSGFAPDQSLVASFHLPAAQVTCPCFVGDGLDRLLVTTAWEGYDASGRAADPGAGYTYLLEAGIRGRPDAEFVVAEQAPG